MRVNPQPPDRCLNCGSSLVREYCADCGQRNVDPRAPVASLVREAAEESFSFDSRVGRTLVAFLFRPGFLAAEWVAGRRARYSSPLKLYLLSSLLFFVAVGVTPREASRVQVGPGAAGGDGPDDGLVIRDTGEIRGHIRGGGFVGAFLEARLQEIARMPPEERRIRLGSAFREWLPRVMFFLVPAGALLLALLWRGRWLSQHAVLSLHLHAFAFACFTAMVAAGWLPWRAVSDALGSALLLALPVYLVLSLRRLYGDPWRRTLLKAAAGSLLYLVALAVGFAAVGALALTFA